MPNLKFQFDDGGRKAAGYRGATGDCVIRALSINLGLDYKDTYQTLIPQQNEHVLGRRSYMGLRTQAKLTMNRAQFDIGQCRGVSVDVYGPVLKEHGWFDRKIDGHLTVKQAIQQYGRTLIFRIANSSVHHLVAVKNGVVRDTWNSSKTRTICQVWSRDIVAPAPAPIPAPVVEIPTNWKATVVCGPEFGETLPRIFTEEIRHRIARQHLNGATIEDLARAWGRTVASIKKITARLSNG